MTGEPGRELCAGLPAAPSRSVEREPPNWRGSAFHGSILMILGLTLWTAPQFRTAVDLVEVYVTVSDPSGQPARGLTAADFEVLEDGVPQHVTTFAAGEFPLAVAIGIDRSWSMAGEPLALARRAAQVFLQALQPADRALLLAIGNDAEVLMPLSADRAAQLAAVARLEPWGATALLDAILTAIDVIEPAGGRRALVLLSDGEDRYSAATDVDVLDRARRADVLIYPVALGPVRPPLFVQLAVATGGRSFHVRHARDLPDTFRAIAEELRHQYLLGYVPARVAEREGVWRSIEVRVSRPNLQIRARDGYYSW